MSRFAKLGKLFAATVGVAAIATSIGMSASPAAAQISGDPYNTNLPHITLRKSNDSADPAKYPNRFVAIQIFRADPDPADPRLLSDIAWGQSIVGSSDTGGAKALLQEMVKSDIALGTFNENYNGEYKDQKWKDANTFGKLFATWLNEKNSNYTDLVGGSVGWATDEAKVSDIADKVTAHDVAEFLDVFAYVNPTAGAPDQDKMNEYPSPSPYTKSEVAAAFARIAANQSLVNASGGEGNDSQDGSETYWTSYAYNKTGAGNEISSVTDAKDSLWAGSGDEGTNGDGWVIDSFGGDGSNDAMGLPTGYYLVIDRFNAVGLGSSLPDHVDGPQEGIISEYMLQVVQNDGAMVTVKSNSPSLDKKIQDGDGLLTSDSTHVGDEVTYVLTGTLPENVKSYHKVDDPEQNVYKMEFVDNVGNALDPVGRGSVEIYVGTSAQGPAAKFAGATKVDLDQSGLTADKIKVDGHKLTITIDNIFQLKDSGGSVIDIKDGFEAGGDVGTASEHRSQIYVVYKATINATALSQNQADPQLQNHVVLNFSNDPYSTGEGTTPEEKTQHYTYGIDLYKHDGTFDGAGLFAGFAVLQGQGSGSAPQPAETTADDKGVQNVGSGKVAWFTRTGDNANNYVYTFAGWHDPVKADSAYVAWFNGDNEGKIAGEQKTQHMHEGMLVNEINAAEKGTHNSDNGGDTVAKYYQVVIADGDAKKAQIRGLDEGVYTILEVLIPQGHDAMNPYTFGFTATTPEISALEQKATLTVNYGDNSGPDGQFKDNEGGTVGERVVQDGVADLDLRNIQGIDLPVTGGMGTALFIGAGVVLVVTACAYTVSRKRRTENAE